MTRSDLLFALESGAFVPLAQARNWSKARVYVGEFLGQKAAAKDVATLPTWFRRLYARPVLGREWAALRALDGLAGVPKALFQVDGDCILMELCAGESLENPPLGAEGEEMLLRLEKLVAGVHARGVTHGDLHRDNILCDENGDLSLIDWATAHVYGAKPRGLKKLAFNEFRALDLRAVAKIKSVCAPQLLNDFERDLLQNGGSGLYRAVKKLRRSLHALQGKKRAPGIDYSKLVK